MMIYLAERGEFKLKANGTVCADSSTGSLRRLMVSWATVHSAGFTWRGRCWSLHQFGPHRRRVTTRCLARAK